MATTATLHSRSGLAGLPRWLALRDRWRASWDHALMQYYRARHRPGMTPWLGMMGILLIWGLLLLGTGLGVAAYPQAADVYCDRQGCHYPLSGSSHPLWSLNLALSGIVAFAFLVMSFLVPLLLVLLGVLRIFAGRLWQRRPDPGKLYLARAWDSGVMPLLVITPPGPAGLVRVSFLTRLYGFWQRRALIAMGIGSMATLFVSEYVVRPTFWWLGPWRQWAVQLLLVLLWSGALVVWLIALAALNTLRDVAGPEQWFSFSLWQAAPALLALVLVVVVVPVSTRLLSLPGSLFPDEHDRVLTAALLMPLLAIGWGALFAVLNYVMAQALFVLRLRRMLG